MFQIEEFAMDNVSKFVCKEENADVWTQLESDFNEIVSRITDKYTNISKDSARELVTMMLASKKCDDVEEVDDDISYTEDESESVCSEDDGVGDEKQVSFSGVLNVAYQAMIVATFVMTCYNTLVSA